MTRDVFVEFVDVYKSYGTKHVLRGANLKVYRGEVLVILGGSGTGKSVTLRHMLGLEAPGVLQGSSDLRRQDLEYLAV